MYWLASVLRRCTPTAAVLLLAQERANRIDEGLRAAAKAQDSEEFDKRVKAICEAPANPLFLASAMARQFQLPDEEENYLRNYVSGLSVDGIDEYYLDCEELARSIPEFLEKDKEFRNAWALCGLWAMRSPSYEHPLEESSRFFWEELCDERQVDKNLVPYWSAVWQAWCLANPWLRALGLDTDMRGYLWRYGFSRNDRFHRVRESMMQKRDDMMHAIKDLVATNIPPEVKQERIALLRADSKLVTSLLERSELLYDWNPCETDAHLVTALMLEQMKHSDAKRQNHSDTEDQKNDDH